MIYNEHTYLICILSCFVFLFHIIYDAYYNCACVSMDNSMNTKEIKS